MRLVLEHDLGRVEINTDVYDDPDTRVIPKISYSGEDSETLKTKFLEVADVAGGAYGHLLSIEATTNFDLDCALDDFEQEGFKVVERDPKTIYANPNFPPEGALS
jgi:hypothetical protein